MTTLFIKKFMNNHLSYGCSILYSMLWSLHLIMHVENVVPENQYIKKYMNILIAQIRKFRLLEISFIIFKYCECVPKIIIIMIMFLKGWQSTKTWLPPNQH